MGRRRRLRSTKLVATIGPACDTIETMCAMIGAGMNVARLNFSHGSHAEHELLAERIREASRQTGANVAVMMDTKGMEIRTGSLEHGTVQLERGDSFTLFTDAREGNQEGVSVSHPKLPQEVQAGSLIYLDDGHIELRVDRCEQDSLYCTVRRGGELGVRKGVNVPGTSLSLGSMGPADLEDLLFGIEIGVDYIAASFVRSAADVLVIREILRSRGAEIPIIAKIESRDGASKLDEIIDVADGTMVARGDLGVELPVEQVPIAQKRIIRATVGAGKPCITATQMLDSMERNSRPTRAEASDVANAILDGTSAVMLSGETAKGRFPLESVEMMARVALEAEASIDEYGDLQQRQRRRVVDAGAAVTEAVAQAATTLARGIDAAAILTLTESGATSRSISKYRPDCPILAVSSIPEVVRKLALNWGVTGLLYGGDTSNDDDKTAFGVSRAREFCAEPGEPIVVTTGISQEAGSTNMIRVVTV